MIEGIPGVSPGRIRDIQKKAAETVAQRQADTDDRLRDIHHRKEARPYGMSNEDLARARRARS